MSIFDPDNQTPVVTQVVDETKTYIEELVGEGKKYKDPEALAKAKLHADMTIAARERELAGLRQELATRNRLEEIADRLSRPPEPPLTPQITNQDDQGTVEKLTPEKVKEIALQAVQAERATSTQAANRAVVVNKLTEAFGENYPETLRAKLTGLEMTEDEANALAVRNPKAFFALLAIPDQPAQQQRQTDGIVPPPRSTINTGFQPTANAKNWDYYEAMRRSPDAKQREKYWSVSVQNEIHKQALANPDPEKFYRQ